MSNGNGHSIKLLNSYTFGCDHFNVHKLYTWHVSYMVQTVDEKTLWLSTLIIWHFNFRYRIRESNDNAFIISLLCDKFLKCIEAWIDLVHINQGCGDISKYIIPIIDNINLCYKISGNEKLTTLTATCICMQQYLEFSIWHEEDLLIGLLWIPKQY